MSQGRKDRLFPRELKEFEDFNFLLNLLAQKRADFIKESLSKKNDSGD